MKGPRGDSPRGLEDVVLLKQMCAFIEPLLVQVRCAISLLLKWTFEGHAAQVPSQHYRNLDQE